MKFSHLVLAGTISLSMVNSVLAQGAVQQIKLTKPQEIQDATNLNKASMDILMKVIPCVTQQKKSVEQCFCQFPTQFDAFKKQYAALLKKYPHWKDKNIVFSVKDGNVGSSTITLILKEVRLRVAQSCNR